MSLSFNHLTIAVSDLARSVRFYTEVVGLHMDATWDRGAYLSAGSTWICLSVDEPMNVGPAQDYTHFAFGCSADEFAEHAQRIRDSGASIWKQNRSEGESLYFLDPDGHQLELHIGNLFTRLESCRASPYAEMRFNDAANSVVKTLPDDLTLHLERDPRAHDAKAVIRGLIDHTERESGMRKRDPQLLSVFLRHQQRGIVGGLNAVTIWGWLHIKEFWVASDLRGRGVGSQILLATETEARRRGCTSSFLDTFDFQAKPFYERFGYQQWGSLAEFPEGHTRFFMMKQLA